MDYFAFVLIGLAGGAACMFFALDKKRKSLQKMRRDQEQQAKEIAHGIEKIRAGEREIAEKTSQFTTARVEFEKQAISHKELNDENAILKRDLRNLAINVRKLELDHRAQHESQETLDRKVQEIGGRYLKENVKWIGNSITPNNYASSKQRLQDVIERCRGIGFQIKQEEEANYIADLRAEFERAVRAAFEREEQARIKAQIREEQKREREIQRELERIEKERAVLQAALEKARAETRDLHSTEIETLEARLAEAEARQRAVSQAQLTKAGYVYVISNIGSFGDGVFKIGMTRRLEPLERVKELGDASVPFPFDVHMMISCENAPSLENVLHRELHKQQLN